MDDKSHLMIPVVPTQWQAGLSGANAGQNPAPAEPEMHLTGTTEPNIPPADISLSDRNVQPLDVPVVPALDDYRPDTPVDLMFYETCQMLVHRYLHRPLPGETSKPFWIARPVHGAMHGTRAAMWIPVLLSWRRQAGDTEALAFPDRLIADVMKAALLHDSGREGEGLDTEAWEQTSGIQCANHLLAMGCPATLAAQCKRGIINKDGRLDTSKKLIDKLIHDADCLEIMRVPEGNAFDMAKLDLYKDFRSDRNLVEEIYSLAQQVREVIADQHDLSGSTRIGNSETNIWESPEQSVWHSWSENEKKVFEFADNALLVQVQHLKENAPELFELYQKSAGSPPEPVGLDPLMMTKIADARGYSAGTGFTGQYEDQKGNRYYIKEPKLPDSARNEVLMVNVAKVLGLKVPSVHLVRKAGRTFVVSEWMEGLKQAPGDALTKDQDPKEAFKKVDPKRLAHLYLVAAVLGNVDIIGASFDNTLFDQEGEMVPLDWGQAGEFDAPEAGASKRKVGTFSGTVYELDTLLNPEHPRVKETIDPTVLPAFHKAANIFQSLDKEAIHSAVGELLVKDTREITRLVEIQGPDTPIDRQRLERTLRERLAYLARRFPECCKQRVTSAEQAAIIAGGVDGYSLPVSGKDIDRADLRLYHCVDKNGEPVTECWVKLKPAAARKLADQLGFPPRHHRALKDLDTYCSALFENPEMSPFWRINLQHMLKLCTDIIVETGQNQARYPSEDRSIVEQALECLNVLKAKISEAAKLQDGEDIRIDHLYELLKKLPKELPEGLPVRVASHAYEKIAESSLPVRDIFHVRAWETGAQNRIPNTHHWKFWPNVIFEYQPSIENKFPLENKLPIEIDWFSDDQLKNAAMEGVVRLRQQGVGREVSLNLVNALAQLGVDTTRPDSAAMQAQYIDALINCYQLDIPMAVKLSEEQDLSGLADQPQEWKKQWLCKQLNWETAPCWKMNHQMHSGRFVFYRPKDNSSEFPPGVQPIHDLELSRKRSTENILKRIYHSGGNLYSIVERMRLGQQLGELSSLEGDLLNGGANNIFYRLTKSEQLISNKFKLVLNQDAHFRTDLQSYNVDQYGSSSDVVKRLSGNTHSLPGHDTWAELAKKRMNENTLTFLNLAEVDRVRVPASKKSKLSHSLSHHLGYWAGGRALSDVLEYSEEYSLDQLQKGPVGEIVKIASMSHQSEMLIDQNPRINNGIIDSLKDLTFDNKNFSNIDFRNIELNNCFFEGFIEFRNCHFNLCQFEEAKFGPDFSDRMNFYDCTLHGKDIEFSQIQNFRFFFTRGTDDSSILQTQTLIFNSAVSHYYGDPENADAEKKAVNLLNQLNKFGLLDCADLTGKINDICIAAADYVGEVWFMGDRYPLHYRFDNDVKRRVHEAAKHLIVKNNDAKKIIPLIAPYSIDIFLMNNKKILRNLSQDKICLRGARFVHDSDFEGIDLLRYDFLSKRQPISKETSDQLTAEILDDKSRIEIVSQLCLLAGMRNVDERQITELILSIPDVNQCRILKNVLAKEIEKGNVIGVKILVDLRPGMTFSCPRNPFLNVLLFPPEDNAIFKAIYSAMQEVGIVKKQRIDYCIDAILKASKGQKYGIVTTLITLLEEMGANKDKWLECYIEAMVMMNDISQANEIGIIFKATLEKAGVSSEDIIECFRQRLIYAINGFNADRAKLLIDFLKKNGATLDLLDENGMTPLSYAIRCWKNPDHYACDFFNEYPGHDEFSKHHGYFSHHNSGPRSRRGHLGFHGHSSHQSEIIADIISVLVKNGANHRDKDGNELIPAVIFKKHQKFFNEF